MIASLVGYNNICLKLNGVSILKNNVFNILKQENTDIFLFKRNNVNEYSTKIFGCNPKVLSAKIIETGWGEHFNDSYQMELKFEYLIKNYLFEETLFNKNIYESDLLLDEGGKYVPPCYGENKIYSLKERELRNEYRQIIINHIDLYKIDKKIPIINEFLNGEIW